MKTRDEINNYINSIKYVNGPIDVFNPDGIYASSEPRFNDFEKLNIELLLDIRDLLTPKE